MGPTLSWVCRRDHLPPEVKIRDRRIVRLEPRPIWPSSAAARPQPRPPLGLLRTCKPTQLAAVPARPPEHTPPETPRNAVPKPPPTPLPKSAKTLSNAQRTNVFGTQGPEVRILSLRPSAPGTAAADPAQRRPGANFAFAVMNNWRRL